ncbi:MAG: sigma-70 family RNA polymerase sigma factor [Fusobacteriaceae bacterium]
MGTLDIDKIIEENMGMVKKIAFTLSRGDDRKFEDYIQEGYIGLIHAAKRFDHKKGLKFSTYAYTTIWGTILNSRRFYNHDFDVRLPGVVNEDMRNQFSPRRLEHPLNEGTVLCDCIAYNDQYKNLDYYELYKAINSLKDREKEIVYKNFFEGKTIEQVAEEIINSKNGEKKISNQRVQQIKAIALERLKKKLWRHYGDDRQSNGF